MTNDHPARPESAAHGFWSGLVNSSERRHRRLVIAATIAQVILIGAIDYLTGPQMSLLVFYILPVCLATAGIGRRFGFFIAFVSVAIWLAGDYAAGARFSSAWIPVWNALIAVATYAIVIWLLTNLLGMHREMENRVRERTAALRSEIAERERLENEILEIGERERRTIGHELHDGLGQHLAGTSLLAEAMAHRLRDRQAEESGEMQRIVGLIEAAIEQSRDLGRGLLLVEIERDGLAAALHELAATTQRQYRVACEFEADSQVEIAQDTTAAHLYRIAQEAVRNAVRHGRTSAIRIRLSQTDGATSLEVSDNGCGLPEPPQRGKGMGLRIMAHRAQMIGGSLFITVPAGGGVRVVCRLPPAAGAPN